jgi:hypothetical protein
VLASCAGTIDAFEDKKASGGSLVANPLTSFAKPDWAKSIGTKNTVSLGPSGPVALEDLVGADGRCAPAVAPAAEIAQAAQPAAADPAPQSAPAEAPPPPPPADRPVGSFAGDLAGPPMPAGPPPALKPMPEPKRTKVAAVAAPPAPAPGMEIGSPQVVGGISLGMSECDAVRRAGQPNNVSIGAGEKGERKVVLTYLTGTRPGIYTFDSGRLKVIDRAPEPPAPPPKAPKKKIVKKKPANSAQLDYERPYVQ